MASKKKNERNQPPFWRWLLGEVLGLVRQVWKPIIWAGVTVFLIFEVAHTFQAFAGKTSVADLALKIATQLNLTVVASLTLSGVTSALWANECRRHRNTRKRLTERTEALEKRLDPNRESSQLNREGTTREGEINDEFNATANVLQFSVVAACWAFLFLKMIPEMRLDSFRQNMFAIRDELFDFAADGNIAFDHPAYMMLRNQMNGFIRYAHHLTVSA